MKSRPLACNGIYITSLFSLKGFFVSYQLNVFNLNVPSIIVFDQDGRLPINLERSDLVNDKLPFTKQFLKDLSYHLVKGIIKFCNTLELLLSESLLNELLKFRVTGMWGVNDGERICKFIISVSENSILPLDYDLLAGAEIDMFCIDATDLENGKGGWGSPELLKICSNYLMVDNIGHSKTSRSRWVRRYFEGYRFHNYGGFSSLPYTGKKILTKKSNVNDIIGGGYVPKSFWQSLACEWENNSWCLLSFGDVPAFNADIDKLVRELDSSGSFGVIFCYLSWNDVKKTGEPSFFSQAWLDENNQNEWFIGLKEPSA